MQRVRVAQWGTGHVGTYCVRGIVAHPQLELVAVGVYSAAKIGVDAGALVDLPPVGVAARRVDDLVASDATCVVHAPGFAGSERNPTQSVDEICTLLAAGKDVASVALMSLTQPATTPPDIAHRIADACARGNSSFYSTGINPGFFADLLPTVLSSLTSGVRSIRTVESYSYEAKAELPPMLGFGAPPGELRTESSRPVMRTDVQMNHDAMYAGLLDALGVVPDELQTVNEVAVATTSFDIRAGRIDAGTVAARRTTTTAYVDGSAFLTAEFIGRTARHVSPEWERPADALGSHRWSVEIDAVPTVRCAVELDDEDAIAAGRMPLPGSAAVAMRAVNAVPALHAAPPGICSQRNLGLYAGARG